MMTLRDLRKRITTCRRRGHLRVGDGCVRCNKNLRNTYTGILPRPVVHNLRPRRKTDAD